MELLLNLAWLLLAFPAFWLWRGRITSRKFSSLQCLLALGCLLVILFPVISATDDLRAMRAEMEESPVSKRSLRQAGTDKTPLWNARAQTSSALASTPAALYAGDESWLHLTTASLLVVTSPAIVRAGRAPPTSFLG